MALRAGEDVIFMVTPSPWFDAGSWVMTLENGEPSYLTGGLAEQEAEEKGWGFWNLLKIKAEAMKGGASLQAMLPGYRITSLHSLPCRFAEPTKDEKGLDSRSRENDA